MEDKKIENRKKFMQVVQKDPIQKCHEFHVKLRKERFYKRSLAKRGLCKTLYDNSGLDSAIMDSSNWLTQELRQELDYQFSDLVENIVKRNDYTSVNNYFEALINDDNIKTLSALFILNNLVKDHDVKFTDNMVEYLWNQINHKIIDSMDDSQVLYHSLILIISLT